MPASAWPLYTLPEVIDFQEGPGILAKDFRDSGVPLIRLSGLERSAALLDGCNYLDPDMVGRRWGHFRVSLGDTLLSTSATLGRIAVVDQAAAGAIPYTGIIRMRPRDGRLMPTFIRYLLASQGFQEQVEAMGVGSVIRHFGPMHLRQMAVPVPPLSQQDGIAAVLGALDGSIELNRRMNETLESTARALFKSWFVEFDPVHAKSEGRAPLGMEAATAALFPSKFEKSSADNVPFGWSARPLDSIASFLNGLALQKFPVTDGEPFFAVLKIAQLRAGSLSGSDRASTAVPPAYIVSDGDLVFSWSGSLMARIWTGGPCALNQHLFKVTSSTLPRWFIRGWVLHHLPRFQSIASAKATTMGHIQRHHLTEASTVVPPAEVVAACGRVIAPLEDRIVANDLQTRTLEHLRATLLPKLLSGEVRVRDAEKTVEHVA